MKKPNCWLFHKQILLGDAGAKTLPFIKLQNLEKPHPDGSGFSYLT
jgi:hypothetical protein